MNGTLLWTNDQKLLDQLAPGTHVRAAFEDRGGRKFPTVQTDERPPARSSGLLWRRRLARACRVIVDESKHTTDSLDPIFADAPPRDACEALRFAFLTGEFR